MKAPPRLLCATLPRDVGVVRLDEASAHHARVLRVKPSDRVVLFDGRGREAHGVVRAIVASSFEIDVSSTGYADALLRGRLVLVQAWPKADKLEIIVRMATELGVNEVRGVDSQHVVVRAEAERRARRLQRLTRIAEEAARQSGRADVPAVLDGGALGDALAAAPPTAARWIAHERADRRLSDEARSNGATPEAWIAVGPEGGFAPDEVRCAEELGWSAVRLAPSVLRVETAAPAALVLALQALWGQSR